MEHGAYGSHGCWVISWMLKGMHGHWEWWIHAPIVKRRPLSVVLDTAECPRVHWALGVHAEPRIKLAFHDTNTAKVAAINKSLLSTRSNAIYDAHVVNDTGAMRMTDYHDHARKVREVSDELSQADENDGDEEIAEIVSILDRAAELLETRGSALFP